MNVKLKREQNKRKRFWIHVQYFSVITVALSVTVLTVAQKLPQVWVTSATLAVLSAIGWFLHSTHTLMDDVRSRIPNPKEFQPIETWRDEINKDLEKADEVWLLSRTGMGWMKYYHEPLDRILRLSPRKLPWSRASVDNRFLLLSPSNDGNQEDRALRMELDNRHWDWNELTYPEYHRKTVGFYDRLVKAYDSLTLKVIDYLAGWTLLIVNPNSTNDSSAIYVELAGFRPDSRERRTFRMTPEDGSIYLYFKNEFLKMWERSKRWPSPAPAGATDSESKAS